MKKMFTYIPSLTLFLTVLVSLVQPCVTLATEPEPEPIILRTAITSTSVIWVGQRVDLQIDVLARDGWAQIKDVRSVEIPGAYLVRLESQGTRLGETISTYEYSGQRYELSIFPQQSGVFAVPPIPVNVEVSQWGAQATTSSAPMETPPISFTAQTPPGAEDLPGIISTSSLEARQQWQPNQKSFKTGDAIKRTIVLTASDISGMAFVPNIFPAIEHVGVYTDEPVVEDHYSRGSLTGKRSETVTYVFEKEGSFELPEIVLPWWNIRKKSLEKIILPALTVNIAGTSGGAASTERHSPSGGQQRISPALLLIVLVPMIMSIIVFWRFRRRLASRYQQWQHKRNQSENAYFQRLAQACQNNDAKETYKGLQAWLSHWQTGSGKITLEKFLHSAASPKLTKAVTALEHNLFKKSAPPDDQPPPWSGQDMYLELRSSRKKLTASRSHQPTSRSTLAPLNPR